LLCHVFGPLVDAGGATIVFYKTNLNATSNVGNTRFINRDVAVVIYDNLFVLFSYYIHYSNDGKSWKAIYYPFYITSNFYNTAKMFIGDSKIYLTNSDNTIYTDMFGADGDDLVRNTTVTHNSPLAHGETLDKFDIGQAVYMSGNVFKFNEATRLYETTTDETNCISSVKSRGTAREYLGICCGKLHRGDKNIGQDTIEFASHGDVYFQVDDSANYEIGDVLLIDKAILGEDVVITGLIRRMIVGKVTAKVNQSFVPVFMD
jgi:hypothetical protein